MNNTKISILTPVHNTSVAFLEKFIASVFAQTYKDWELCLVNDCSSNKDTLTYIQSLNDPRIKKYDNPTNLGIGLATQEAYKISTGSFIAFADSDDELHPEALKKSIETITKLNSDVVYSDEANIDENNKILIPHYKPDFSLDYLMSQNYLCHFVVLKRLIFEKAGGMRGGFDGSQDHDFLLRVSKVANRIDHIPEILYYWRMVKNSITNYAETRDKVWNRGAKSIEDFLQNNNIKGSVEKGSSLGTYNVRRVIDGCPVVSIIIPFKDNILNLDDCIKAITTQSSYRNYEIIVVNTDINNELKLKKFEGRAKVITESNILKYPAIINIGVQESRGEYIIIIHDDTKPIKNDWIEALLEHAQRSEVGVVGGRLLYPNNTVQHAGITIGVGGILSHNHANIKASDNGYFCRAKIIQNVSAVTSACMMFKKTTFDSIGGFDSNNFSIDYSDVDFCLRLRERGLLIVYTPNCEVTHLARNSRGSVYTLKTREEINKNEVRYMHSKYADLFLKGDPYYNKNLSKSRAFDYRIPQPSTSLLNKVPLSWGNPIQTQAPLNSNYIKPQNTNIDTPGVTSKNNSKPNITIQSIIPSPIKEVLSFIIPMYNCYPVVLGSLLAQTVWEWEAIVVHDGEIPDDAKKQLSQYDDKRIKIFNTDKVNNDWGHAARDLGLTKVSADSTLVVFTGADNYYVPRFTELMVQPFKQKNIVAAYCNCIHNYWDWERLNTRLAFGQIDCGCFVARTKAAKEIGWKYRVHESDWLFINEVARKYGKDSIAKVHKNLFVHN